MDGRVPGKVTDDAVAGTAVHIGVAHRSGRCPGSCDPTCCGASATCNGRLDAWPIFRLASGSILAEAAPANAQLAVVKAGLQAGFCREGATPRQQWRKPSRP